MAKAPQARAQVRGGAAPNGAQTMVIPDDVGPDTSFLDDATEPGAADDMDAREADLAAREAAFLARQNVASQGQTSDLEAITNSLKLGASAKGAPVGMPKTHRIIVEEAAGSEIPPTGLPISLNGKAYLIRPGEEVNVPPGITEILDNAVMSIPVVDPQTNKVIGYRKRLRFPYRRIAA